MEKTIKARASLFLLGLVLLYLCIQFHEGFHWIIAVCLGAVVKYVECQRIVAAADAAWKSIAICGAGSFFTILIIMAGLLMFRSRNQTARKLGFLNVFLNGFGRIGYELSPMLIGTGTDEISVAYLLGIHSAFVRVPLTVFCVASALYVTLKNRKSGPARIEWFVPACMMPAAFALILAFSAMLNILMKTGGPFFQPILMGYPPFLVCVNLVQCAFLLLLIHPRLSRRAAVLLAAGIFNLALAGSAVAVIVADGARAPRVAEIMPAGRNLDDLVKNGSRIEVTFDRAMDPGIPSFARDISYLDGAGPLEATAAWSAPDTLVCSFSRGVLAGEDIRLRIKGLRDAEGNPMRGEILLEFR